MPFPMRLHRPPVVPFRLSFAASTAIELRLPVGRSGGQSLGFHQFRAIATASCGRAASFATACQSVLA